MKDLDILDNLELEPHILPKKICYSCKFNKSELLENICIQDKNNILTLEEAANKNFINNECPYYKIKLINKLKSTLKIK